jgi:hypothetical protein
LNGVGGRLRVGYVSVIGLLVVMAILGQFVPTLTNPLVMIAAALIAIGLELNHQAG